MAKKRYPTRKARKSQTAKDEQSIQPRNPSATRDDRKEERILYGEPESTSNRQGNPDGPTTSNPGGMQPTSDAAINSGLGNWDQSQGRKSDAGEHVPTLMPFQPYSIGKDDGDRPTQKTLDSNQSKTGLGKEEERETKKQSDSGETPNCSRIQQGSEHRDKTSIKESHEELMRYIPQPLQRFIEKIDNPPKDGDCGYTCVAWKLIRKHLSAELKKDKKMYEMIEGRTIDEDIRNTQAGKSAGVAGWLMTPLFGYAIANHLRRPLYYYSLDSMHTYLPTSSSYSGYPPFCMAFVNSNHYVVLHFKKVNGSIPAPPIDGWWLRKNLKLFQKIMPSASGGAVINVY
ncbi:hypothetical protein BY996DRAFT_6567072 [Phakopsora pachyrhizi]|nr:hypothetical protein BY996DRAFT_6567072 [Phakopsora pachyrhizi]